MAHPMQRKLKRKEVIQIYCMGNMKKFLQETTLHGFKYLADKSLNSWEKLFFFTAVAVCFIIVANFISNIYARWDSTPVIIGISPQPTSILKIPFPAITICNMNMVLKSKAGNFTNSKSYEYAILKYLCYPETEFDTVLEQSQIYKNNHFRLDTFLKENAQPCARMLLYCSLSSVVYNCSDLFHEILTDEGVCCIFNMVHPEFLFKRSYEHVKPPPEKQGIKAMDWNPEDGYTEDLPQQYYPRPVFGTGISMGMTLILNAELDEYFCSTTNGPGFKVFLSNPIDTPNVKETGLIIPLGYETRFRLEALRSESAAAIRSINRHRRQCVFLNEEHLNYYKYYTKRNCESECQAAYLWSTCHCVPYHLPLIFSNTTVCSMKDAFCSSRAQRRFARGMASNCLKRCQTTCFDLSFLPDAMSSPLSRENFTIQSRILQELDRSQIRKNMAVMHFYYRESVLYADLKNVYIGLTEFLSNTGGIMGLFMGFSFISIAEIVYFSVMRPIFKFAVPQKYRKMGVKVHDNNEMDNQYWISDEICKPRAMPQAQAQALDVPIESLVV